MAVYDFDKIVMKLQKPPLGEPACRTGRVWRAL